MARAWRRREKRVDARHAELLSVMCCLQGVKKSPADFMPEEPGDEERRAANARKLLEFGLRNMVANLPPMKAPRRKKTKRTKRKNSHGK